LINQSLLSFASPAKTRGEKICKAASIAQDIERRREVKLTIVHCSRSRPRSPIVNTKPRTAILDYRTAAFDQPIGLVKGHCAARFEEPGNH
jgi:hypothetical protein